MEDVTLRGGAFAGRSYWSSSFATWPFVRLTISSTCLTLAIPGLLPFRFEFEIPKEAIQKLVLTEGNFLFLPGVPIAGLRINHSLSGVPSYLVFSTFDPERLKSVLKAAGFELSAS
jgi:hypothetical protein